MVNPLWVLPGDIWGDSRSHILHDGLNPVATDSRGHGRQSTSSLFTLKVHRHLIAMIYNQLICLYQSQNEDIQACNSTLL